MNHLLKTEQTITENQPGSLDTAESSLRVLHIGKYFPPYAGGMETYLRDLMVAQIEQGLKSTALVHQSALSLRSSTEQYPAGEHTFCVTRAAVWLRLLFTPISPTFPWLLNRLIKEKKPDLLHLHMPNLSVFWALLLPSARRIPWVVQWQSDVLASKHRLGLRLFYALYKPFESTVLRHSTRLIASSPPYLESSTTLAPFRDKCEGIPLGMRPPPQVQENLPVVQGTESRPLRVLAIGRLTYYKGFQYLIRAMAQVPEALVEAARLDGCGHLEIWRRVMLPMCKPVIAITAVFTFIYVWNDFLGPLIYLHSEDKATLAIALNSFRNQYGGLEDVQYLMAVSLVTMLPCIALFFVAQKQFVEGLGKGAVKG